MSSNSVCTNQAVFNSSFRDAVKAYNKHEEPKKWVMVVMALLYLVLVIWSVMLALSVRSKNSQSLHIVLAVLFPPFYIVAYYLDGM